MDQEQQTPDTPDTQEMSGGDQSAPAVGQEQKKPTPWWGFPRCDEIPEPGPAQQALNKAGQWAQDKILTGAPAPLKWLANKIAPWSSKDGMGRCPVDKDGDKSQ